MSFVILETINNNAVMKNHYLFLIFALIFVSCTGTSSIYDFNYPLTQELVKSKTARISVKIPKGWSAIDDNDCKCTDLWLVKDDYSATLNFVAFNLDSLSAGNNRNDELASLITLSKAFVKAKYGNEFKGFSQDEIFKINKNKYARRINILMIK